MKRVAPYGTWTSPITADLVASAGLRLGEIALDGDGVYWVEGRPLEQGRNVIVRRGAHGCVEDVTPAGFDVRTRVHEYGGGAFTVADGAVYFVNLRDQQVYRQPVGEARPVAVTSAAGRRFADLVVDRSRDQLLAVCEDHRRKRAEPENSLVAIPLQGGEPVTLAAGHDFFSSPRVSPDGRQMCWLAWDHPNMPWDGTELWVAELDRGGVPKDNCRIAGGPTESIFQPEWAPDGVLFFVNDRSGWWNLYRHGDGATSSVVEMNAEFGLPQWVFGMSTYAVVSANGLVAAYTRAGVWHLARIRLHGDGASIERIELPYTWMTGVRAAERTVAMQAGSAVQPVAVITLDLDSECVETLRSSCDVAVDGGHLPEPEAVSFSTEDGLTAHGFFYAPVNRDHAAPPGETPPLLVMSHGGPTAATSPVFSLKTAFWTSRGFAVLDVNYGGSTGYGRAYRERLRGRWGIVDVDDCVNGARRLAQAGLVDPQRMAITGGSAGGYTTLCALTFRDTFRAGASYYGVSDLEALARDTHKFESRYLDGLVGPYPEARAAYRERSPIHHVSGLSCPVIFFQGALDVVVPRSQAERMVESLRARGLRTEYVLFDDEHHGFRCAANIASALDREHAFYVDALGL